MNLEHFEQLYAKYNHRHFVHPDPLEFLYDFPELKDREIVGLIASSLAYGRVAQILKSVSKVLTEMKGKPHKFLLESDDKELRKQFKNFKHRFTTGDDLVNLLIGIKQIVKKHGSLQSCFINILRASPDGESRSNYMSALEKFVACFPKTQLLPPPELGSACKRLNLYLRWMIRKDAVDPGGWDDLEPAKLIIPLDTHMYKVGLKYKFTSRKQANLKTAIEITNAFSRIIPHDPVKYDFALTRPGIRNEKNS